MKQQFGSLRSYLEMQHIVYSLSFPEDIAPDFIIRLRIDDNEEMSSGPYSDGSDIDDENDERDNGGNNKIVDDKEVDEEENEDDDDGDDEEEEDDEEDEVVDLKTSSTTATKKPILKDVTEAVYESDSASTKDNRNNYNNDYNPEYALIDKMTLKELKINMEHNDDVINMTKQDMRNKLYHDAYLTSTDINDVESNTRKLFQKIASMETVPRLKAVLQKRGQKLSGSKDVLRDRFVETALCRERYSHLIKKWQDLKVELAEELYLKRDIGNSADEDLNDSSKLKYTASKLNIISKKIKLLTTKSVKEIIRLENEVRNKKNKNDMTTIIDQERISMIMNLLQAQLSSSSKDLIYYNDVMKGIKIENQDFYFDSIIQSKNQNKKQNENENEYSTKNLLEAYVQPVIDSSHSPTNIKSSRTSLKNQLISTSTSSTIPPLIKRYDIIDDKKIIEVIVNFLKESDDLKVTH